MSQGANNPCTANSVFGLRGPKRVGNHVRWRETERHDQARQVILVVAAGAWFGAVLAASMSATVVADHSETAGEILLDERPYLPVVPASMNKNERLPE